jgi:hypothetical protein
MSRKRKPPQFLLCVCNEGCDDLEVRKLYQVLPDTSAAKEGYVRIIDESGKDYLYPTEYFLAISLPETIAEEFAVPA